MTNLQQKLKELPEDASEAIISANFIPSFLEALGFHPTQGDYN